jgi:hypothetical protein
MTGESIQKSAPCRLIAVGGHTRSIGKTQLVCDLIAALPGANWLAGKITQYGHGVCAQNGQDCDCAPTEHVVALDWEAPGSSRADSARFLEAGAARAFWLRTKQGYLAEGMPLLREALESAARTSENEAVNVIVESNSLLQFVKPSLYVTVLDTAREDFKESARQMLDRADVLLFRRGLRESEIALPPWRGLPRQLLGERLSLLQREGEPLPEPLLELLKRILESEPTVRI